MAFKDSVLKVINNLHISAYRRTGGLVGGQIGRMRVLLLTTTGRKTGKHRTVPVLYDTDGQDLVIIASNGGAPTHPAWYSNLEANPQVEVELGSEKQKLVARTVSPEERSRLWERMVAKYPGYAGYQKKVERVLPVVVLRPQ